MKKRSHDHKIIQVLASILLVVVLLIADMPQADTTLALGSLDEPVAIEQGQPAVNEATGPGETKEDPQTEPGEGSIKDKEEPGQGSGEDADKPGQGFGEDADKPGQVSGEETDEPGQGSGEDADKPGQGSEEDKEEPGEGSEEDKAEPGEGSGEDTDEPGEETEEDTDKPGEESEEEGSAPEEELTEAAGPPAAGANDPHSIAGFFWVDGNGDLDTDWDGLYNGYELPLQGYTVNLYAVDNLTKSIAETKTDSDGKYIFTELQPGSYKLGIRGESIGGIDYLPPVFITEDNKFAIDWSISGLPAYTEVIELTQGQAVQDINAGLRLPMGISPYADTPLATVWADNNIGKTVTLDGYAWVVIKKLTVDDLNTVLLVRTGASNTPVKFGDSKNYENSNLQAWMTNFYEKSIPYIKTIAVVPTLGNHSDKSAISLPTAKPAAAASSSKDIVFALSRGDIYQGADIGGSFYPIAVANAMKSYYAAERQLMRTAAEGVDVYGWFRRSDTGNAQIDSGIKHDAAGVNGPRAAPAVWISTTPLLYTVTVNYLDMAGKQIRNPDTHDVYYNEPFDLKTIPEIEGYEYNKEWKEGSVDAPTKTTPVSIANVTANKVIYLYYKRAATEITVTKTVVGDYGIDPSQLFKFTIYLQDSNGKSLSAGTKLEAWLTIPEIPIPIPLEPPVVLGEGGVGTFYLGDGRTITFKDIPVDARISIVEETVTWQYFMTYTDSKYVGALYEYDMPFNTVGEAPRVFSFTNYLVPPPPPTGIDAGFTSMEALLLLTALVILAGFVSFGHLRKRLWH